MTTHTDLIARLREYAAYDKPCVTTHAEAADALESLEQQVAALTKERDEREGSVCDQCIDGSGWCENAVEGRYPCTCMTEAEPYQLLQEQLAAAQALVAKLQGKLFHFGRHHSNCGWQMNKPCNCGFDEALALHADDSALQARLKEEYEKGYVDASEILTGVDRSMT